MSFALLSISTEITDVQVANILENRHSVANAGTASTFIFSGGFAVCEMGPPASKTRTV
jgi:hypothetical protein